MAYLKLRETYIAQDDSYWSGYWGKLGIGRAFHIPMDTIYPKTKKAHRNRMLTIVRRGKENFNAAFRRTVEEFIRGEE